MSTIGERANGPFRILRRDYAVSGKWDLFFTEQNFDIALSLAKILESKGDTIEILDRDGDRRHI